MRNAGLASMLWIAGCVTATEISEAPLGAPEGGFTDVRDIELGQIGLGGQLQPDAPPTFRFRGVAGQNLEILSWGDSWWKVSDLAGHFVESARNRYFADHELYRWQPRNGSTDREDASNWMLLRRHVRPGEEPTWPFDGSGFGNWPGTKQTRFLLPETTEYVVRIVPRWRALEPPALAYGVFLHEVDGRDATPGSLVLGARYHGAPLPGGYFVVAGRAAQADVSATARLDDLTPNVYSIGFVHPDLATLGLVWREAAVAPGRETKATFTIEDLAPWFLVSLDPG